MNRREFLKFGAVSFVSALFPLSIYHYVNSNNSKLKQGIREVIENRVYLETDFKYTREEQTEVRSAEMAGHGTIVGGYVFTVDHLLEKKIDFENYGGGSIYWDLTKVSTDTKIGKSRLELIASDYDLDIAVLKLPKDYQKPKTKVRLGDSDKLKPLDKVYLIGDPRDKQIIIREGIVSNEIERRKTVGENSLVSYGFNTSIQLFPGDSGSPLLNEEGEIVGFANHMLGFYASNMVPINDFKRIRDGERTDIQPI